MTILGKEVGRVMPVGANVLIRVIKEEIESMSATGIIISPQKTVYFRSEVVAISAESRMIGILDIGDFVELTGQPLPCINDENGKCTLMMVPDDAIIGVYKTRA